MALDSKLKEKLFGNRIDPDEYLLEEVDCEKRIATYSPSVNWALQGGIVPGRFYCFVGPEGSGKSMFAVSCCANILKANPDGMVVWFDTEESWDGHWLKIYMSDERGFTEEDRRERFIVLQAQYGKEIFDYYTNELVPHHGENKILACVVDSKDAIKAPKEANAKSTEDHVMGDLSQYLPKAFRNILKASRQCQTSWFFISQVGLVFDEMEKRLKGKWKISGGQKFLHYVDAIMLFEQLQGNVNKILDSTKTGMDDNPIQLGNYVKMKVWGKCRVGVPNRVAKFKFLYDQGIVDTWEEVADLAVRLGIIKKEGRTYFNGDVKVAVNESEYFDKVKLGKELQDELYGKIITE
jgi:RecA/RadA recombinase